jgi:dihydrodipicolinate synthase/N-acetylneuraminate lyase
LTERSDWGRVWGFPLTPFSEHGINAELLTLATKFQVAGGVDLVCACGLIAQVEQLTAAEHRESVRTVVAAATGVPVVATVVADESAPDLASAAVEMGASGLLVIPTSPSAQTTLDQLGAIAAVAPHVPQILYHRPPLRVDGAELRALAELPELAWIKDGHRDVRLFRQLRAAVKRLRWVSAWEDVALAFSAMGCDAFAPASTAYAPDYARAWIDSLERGDVDHARALLSFHAYPLVDLRLSRPQIDVSVVKAAMAARGLGPGLTRAPASPLTDDEHRAVQRLVGELAARPISVR